MSDGTWTPPADWKSARLVALQHLLLEPDVTLDEVLALFTDADLLGELVRRGVLRKIEYNSWKDGAQILRQYVYEELVPVGESE